MAPAQTKIWLVTPSVNQLVRVQLVACTVCVGARQVLVVAFGQVAVLHRGGVAPNRRASVPEYGSPVSGQFLT
jgi:hypothetical protein